MTNDSRNNVESELGLILRALEFAAHKHRDQRRKVDGARDVERHQPRRGRRPDDKTPAGILPGRRFDAGYDGHNP